MNRDKLSHDDFYFIMDWIKKGMSPKASTMFTAGLMRDIGLLCEEAYNKALDDNDILYGEDADRFLRDTGLDGKGEEK